MQAVVLQAMGLESVNNSSTRQLNHRHQGVFGLAKMAARTERQLLKTQQRLTRAFDAGEFYEAEQLTLSLHSRYLHSLRMKYTIVHVLDDSRLKGLDRDEQAQELLWSSLNKLIDHGRVRAASHLLGSLPHTSASLAQTSFAPSVWFNP
jgi:hypothetical protein